MVPLDTNQFEQIARGIGYRQSIDYAWFDVDSARHDLAGYHLNRNGRLLGRKREVTEAQRRDVDCAQQGFGDVRFGHGSEKRTIAGDDVTLKQGQSDVHT